tara:strand:- start:5421 stop:5711 length:291 start_codon:yes stop_codon:yes gene_type:complete
MADKTGKGKPISRRGILPLLGSTLLIPFLGFGKEEVNETKDSDSTNDNNDDYKILLRPDGTTVKVKTNAVKQANLVKKNISNKSFLNWLGKDSESK